MLKKLTILLVLTVCFSGFSAFAEAAKDASPIRFSLCPGFGWPKKDVTGLNLGLIGDQDKEKSVVGTDMSLLVTLTKNVKGCQSAIVSLTEGSEMTQSGVVTYANKSKGTQWGLVNIGKDTEGLQLGLINIMNNGWLPVFIFFNFSK